VASLYEAPVTIKNLERAIVDRGFAEGWIVPDPPRFRSGKSVAVVGSGPSGLACAAQLNKAGHRVTVFERDDRIGGLLTYGIPKTKIAQDVVDRRVNLLQEEGIRFVTGVEIGREMAFEELRSEFDAVILCLGATKPRDLPAKGRELSGVHYAMDFLHQNTKSLLDSGHADGNFISAEGLDVIVIGGGDTATDCVSTAMRHRCRSLVQFDIHDRKPDSRDSDNPWPLWPVVHKLDSGQEEAEAVFGDDPRLFAVSAMEFLDDGQGNVGAVRCVQLREEKNPSGQWTREEIPGSEQIWPAQLVLLAIGFRGPEMDSFGQTDIRVDGRSNIDAPSYATSLPGVFAAGDARRGQSLIVWAIREGREVAEVCDQYLRRK
jgi:glutamate synthase (NADPH/NADH) small chain